MPPREGVRFRRKSSDAAGDEGDRKSDAEANGTINKGAEYQEVGAQSESVDRPGEVDHFASRGDDAEQTPNQPDQ
jgi:hypothetical protein